MQGCLYSNFKFVNGVATPYTFITPIATTVLASSLSKTLVIATCNFSLAFALRTSYRPFDFDPGPKLALPLPAPDFALPVPLSIRRVSPTILWIFTFENLPGSLTKLNLLSSSFYLSHLGLVRRPLSGPFPTPCRLPIPTTDHHSQHPSVNASQWLPLHHPNTPPLSPLPKHRRVAPPSRTHCQSRSSHFSVPLTSQS